MSTTPRYDYIIAGAGCAGLSLVMRMIESGKFSNKRILVADKEEKKNNDRTWCFWETSADLFEPIVYHSWKHTWFHGESFSGLLSLQPYQYKLIRGIDFYNFCFERIRKQPGIDIIKGEISGMRSDEEETSLLINGDKYIAEYIFNSILFDKPVLKKKEYYLLQHFKGWMIETEKPAFNPNEATLMDFRVHQLHGTTFVYVMPFSTTKALIEYTLFSENLLPSSGYDEGLQKYIAEYTGAGNYKVTEQEFGVIPMTNHRFASHENNIIHIGTAGGQTKASSGYTFRFIQKQSKAIVDAMEKTRKPFVSSHPGKRFHFYDSTLLYILKKKKLTGKEIFTDLFQKNKPQQLLRFLDNESSLKDEIKIISSLPIGPFFRAGLKQL